MSITSVIAGDYQMVTLVVVGALAMLAVAYFAWSN